MTSIVEIHPSVLAGIPSGGTWQASGGLIEAGTVYPSSDGGRLLTHIVENNAYYIQTEQITNEPWKVGRVYKQSIFYFASDATKGGTGATLKKSLAGTKSVISDFLDIYLGCLSVASGPLAISITGMNLVVAGGKIKQNYDLYNDALEAFVSDDMALQKMMPIFFDHMFVELYLGRIEADLTGKAKEVATSLITKKFVKGEAARKIVNNTIGVFVGKIGEDAMKRILTGISKIIKDILLKVADHAITKGPNSVSEEQVGQLATHHIVPEYAALSRVPMRMDRAQEIIRETARNAQAVKPRLQKIAKAIDALNG